MRERQTWLPGLALDSVCVPSAGGTQGPTARARGCPAQLCTAGGGPTAPAWPGAARVGALGACVGDSAAPGPAPLPRPKPLVGRLWNHAPNPQAQSKGPRPFPPPSTRPLSRRNFLLFFNQQHATLPEATRHYSGVSQVSSPSLALACSDETLYVFCMA